jgi:hypothetical protein
LSLPGFKHQSVQSKDYSITDICRNSYFFWEICINCREEISVLFNVKRYPLTDTTLSH